MEQFKRGAKASATTEERVTDKVGVREHREFGHNHHREVNYNSNGNTEVNLTVREVVLSTIHENSERASHSFYTDTRPTSPNNDQCQQ